MPWTTANGISIHYQLAGEHGPVVVLLHEMGGTLDSWDAVAPGLAEHYRVLRYDQRGAGLSEKVRKQFTNDDAVGDLEGVLKNLDLKPPYNFVCVAAARTQVLRFLEKHPEQVTSIVLCNPAPGVDPSRAGALQRARRPGRDATACAASWGSRSTSPIRRRSASPPPTRPIAAAISPTIRSASGSRTACWR